MSTISDIQRAVGVKADGVFGSITQAAVAERLGCAATTKEIQRTVGAAQDGVMGPRTLAAIAAKLGVQVQVTQSEVRSGKSIYGAAGDESNLVRIAPPYTLYFDGKPVTSIRVHRLVATRVSEVLNKVLAHYGAERIHALGLDVYDGAYTYKRTTGGSSMSIHAWGLAIDFGAARNGLHVHAPQAQFSGKEYEAWWRIWEEAGWHSLGREKNYDWMHVQAVPFN